MLLEHWYTNICLSACFSILWGVIQLDYMLILYLTFQGNITLFSRAAVPLCIPTSNAQRFHPLHVFSRACHFLFLIVAIPMVVKSQEVLIYRLEPRENFLLGEARGQGSWVY